MEDLLNQIQTMIETERVIENINSQQQQPITRISAAQSIIKSETLQNSQINESKEHTDNLKQLVQKCRIDFLNIVSSAYQKKLSHNEESLKDFKQILYNYQYNYGYLGENKLYPWQLIQSLDLLRQNDGGLVFISDKNVFSKAGLVYSIIRDAFLLSFGEEVVNVFDVQQKKEEQKSELELDEKLIENIWNNIMNTNTQKQQTFFLNLENVTPVKIIFIAKLQKYYESMKESKGQPRLIIYSEDILSAQLKGVFKPQSEIVLELHRMPQNVSYTEESGFGSQQKFQQIESIVNDSLKKYKQTLMRYDFLIFVKNNEEATYLRDHHLNLIKQKLNVIDLTDQEIENEEKTFFEEEFKKKWIQSEQIRKQKEEEQRIKAEQEQLLKKQKEEEEKMKKLEEEKLKKEEEERKKKEEERLRQEEEERIKEEQKNQQEQQQQLGEIPNPIEPKEGEVVQQPEIQVEIKQEVQQVIEVVEDEEARIQRENQERIQKEEEQKQKELEQKKQEEEARKQEEEARIKAEEEKKQKEIQQKKDEQERYEAALFKELNQHKQDLYKKNEFNVYIAKSHKQLKYHKLDNILIQIDTGEALKVYFMDTNFESTPVVSSKITREEALKRERLMGHSKSCEIHRLYTRKEFLRLQKRDFLNLINLEQFKSYSEITEEKCQEKQVIRILLHVMLNLSENWFTCQTETCAHVSIIWSRMGDVFSIHNSILLIPQDSTAQLTSNNLTLKSNIEKNQISSSQFDHIVQQIINIASNLRLQINPIKVLQGIESSKFSEILQQIVIQKYYKNVCVYSGHRRHGFRHFQSQQMFNYADLSSMNLIQERPFLIIPLQLQINSKNQYEIKQCIAVDHLFLIENAPSQFLDKYQLRLLKRQSLNLHEIEYFGISGAMFQYFEQNKNLIKELETKYDCYYEPNHHMDTITLHCDASQKEKVEKQFKIYMDEAQKILADEILEVSHGNNSILKIQKGGVIKDVIILENDHIFIAENLHPSTKEQDLIDLFSEYGDILSVKFFTNPNSENIIEEQTLSAEILVAETEDSSFFIETFNQTDFKGRLLQLRSKNHSYKIHTDNNSMKYHNIFRWQTWKSKLTAKISFADESSVSAFMKLVQNKLVIDSKEIKAEVDKNDKKLINLSDLHKHTDEQSIKSILSPELQKNLVRLCVDRIADVDRGISKASLIHVLNKVYHEQHQIDWVKKKENGIIEAKICYSKNHGYKMLTYHQRFNGKPDIIGQSKLYIENHYTQTFNFDFQLMKVVQTILKGNQELVDMEQKKEIRIKEKIVRPIPSKQDLLIILKCSDETNFNKAKAIISAILSPKILDLRNIKLDLVSLFDEDDQVDYSQIFTEIGQKKLRELEKKYPVFFKINLLKQDVRVFCTDPIYELINKEVEYFLRQSIRVKIPVSGKNIRNILGIDGRGLEELKQKFQLCKIQLDYISKDVYMEGNSKQVDQAKNALLALLEEKNSSACFNNMPYSYEDCQVCSNTITTGYRLQGCGHKFCISCIMFVIDNSLNDINSLPIKCPFCSKAVIMKDLKALMTEEQLQKMTRMALNHYVQNNFQEVNFCVNENCRSIHSSKLTKYTCYECKKTYCSKCQAEYHYGMTCSFYLETEAKNIEFLIKEGARKCPHCSVFIMRIDGCYRVECSRCHMHICWKDNCMIFFDNASACYSHLDEKHGGYW